MIWNYLRWNSCSPQKRKINLIGTLVHRAFMICFKSKLDTELGKNRSILLENGFPEYAINSAFKQKLQQLNSTPVHTVEKSTYTSHGLEMSHEVLKADYVCCETLLFSPSNHVLFSTPDSSYQQLRKTCYLPIITAMLFTNLCATAIVGTLVARFNA